MLLSPELTAALEAARAADEVIRRYYREGFRVDTKGDTTPVTEADIAAEDTIKTILMQRFPDYGFYGEEGGKHNAEAPSVWLVDPIDGTKSFVRGYPFFSTQIALMREGSLVLGVSNAPEYGELAYAERGRGAYLNESPIRVSDITTLGDATLSLGNPRSLAQDARWGRLAPLIAEADRVRGFGDFLHYHLLASGRLEAVIESDLNILDIAALSVIVTEAGGVFTDLAGGPVDLMTHSVLAANGAGLHERIRQALA
jgi:histidinol-phosphatase